jgi:hypothetical protein
MRIFFPLLFATLVILFFGLCELLLLRFLNPAWWRNRYVRAAAWGLPLLGTVSVLAWGLGEYYTVNRLVLPASIMAALMFILEVALMLSLPLSGFLHLLHWVAERFASRQKSKESYIPDPNRRIILKTAAVGLPLVTVVTGVSGLARAFGAVEVVPKPITVDGLPRDLEGLKILHLSDLHLRHYVTLDDLAAVLMKAEQLPPDLIVVTGDIADDLRLLPDALAMIAELKPPLGAFACLGNHEYFRGVNTVRRIFDRSPMPLLVNEGTTLTVGATSLFVGGIDDPRFLSVRDRRFFNRAIDLTLDNANGDSFILLMSHRPDAFDFAVASGVALTLAGHTHGGQIGLMNRSLFEVMWPNRYFWGHYQTGQSHLYTSSGVGHWFPFRLGCPPEAPVITLRGH